MARRMEPSNVMMDRRIAIQSPMPVAQRVSILSAAMAFSIVKRNVTMEILLRKMDARTALSISAGMASSILGRPVTMDARHQASLQDVMRTPWTIWMAARCGALRRVLRRFAGMQSAKDLRSAMMEILGAEMGVPRSARWNTVGTV
jgi:hypothetical protein